MGFVTIMMFPGDHSMEYYTTRQAAEIFGVTPITVRRWIWSDDLIFIRLAANGDKVVGAFVGEPFAREVVWTGERYETFDPAVHTDKRPSLRVMLNFFVPAESDMKVIEGSTVWFKDVLKVRGKYGLDKWLFEIERHGDAGDPKTTYSIMPEEKIDDAMRARIRDAEAHDLAALSFPNPEFASRERIAVNPKGEGGPRKCQQFIITGDSVERLLRLRGSSRSASRPSGSGSQASR